MTVIITRPEKSEYHEYFASYVNLVPEGDLIELLLVQNKDTNKMFMELTDLQGLFKYAPEKWSVKEVIGHLTDTERILSYPLLCIARGEAISLPKYDKNDYIKNAMFDKQQLEELLLHLISVRKSTICLLKALQPEDWLRRGSANGQEVTVRALVTILLGHELHHRGLINERYFASRDFPLQ